MKRRATLLRQLVRLNQISLLFDDAPQRTPYEVLSEKVLPSGEGRLKYLSQFNGALFEAATVPLLAQEYGLACMAHPANSGYDLAVLPSALQPGTIVEVKGASGPWKTDFHQLLCYLEELRASQGTPRPFHRLLYVLWHYKRGVVKLRTAMDVVRHCLGTTSVVVICDASFLWYYLRSRSLLPYHGWEGFQTIPYTKLLKAASARPDLFRYTQEPGYLDLSEEGLGHAEFDLHHVHPVDGATLANVHRIPQRDLPPEMYQGFPPGALERFFGPDEYGEAKPVVKAADDDIPF